MEFLAGLFIIFILAAIFGPKKGSKRRRSKLPEKGAERKYQQDSGPKRLKPRVRTKSQLENERLLLQAHKDGEVLTVAYSGGMQPGTTRQIFPIKFHSNKVRAYCHTSKSEKDFFVEKIKILPPDTPVTYQDFESNGSLESIDSFKREYLPAFEAKGWTVKHVDDRLELFDHFKNMKPRKTPALALAYSPTYEDYDWDGAEGELVTRERSRPWSVVTRQGSSHYRDLRKALVKFLLLEKELSPFRD